MVYFLRVGASVPCRANNTLRHARERDIRMQSEMCRSRLLLLSPRPRVARVRRSEEVVFLLALHHGAGCPHLTPGVSRSVALPTSGGAGRSGRSRGDTVGRRPGRPWCLGSAGRTSNGLRHELHWSPPAGRRTLYGPRPAVPPPSRLAVGPPVMTLLGQVQLPGTKPQCKQTIRTWSEWQFDSCYS